MGGMFSDYIIFWLTLEGERFFNRWPKWAVFDLLRLGIVSAPSSSPSFPPFALHCFPASQILWESRWGVPRPSCGLERWPAPFFFEGGTQFSGSPPAPPIKPGQLVVRPGEGGWDRDQRWC